MLRRPARCFVLLVLCLWGLYPLLIYSGLFAYWYQYSTAPVQGAALLGTGSFENDDYGGVFLQAEDGTIHVYFTWPGGWYTVQQPEIVSQPCTAWVLRLSTVFAPFDPPFQCAYTYGEVDLVSAPRLFFVLDQQGNLWGSYGLRGTLNNAWGTYLFGSLLLGLAASLGYLLINHLRLRHDPTADRMARRAQAARIIHAQARLWSFTLIAGLAFDHLFTTPHAIPLALDIATAAGLLLGWFLPLPGGGLVILVTLLRVVLEFQDARNSYALPEFFVFWLIFVIPAVLYLLAWGSRRMLPRMNTDKANPDI